MFDSENFLKALMYLRQEALIADQADLVGILNDTIHQVECSYKDEQTPHERYAFSDIVEKFMKLDKKMQRIIINALEASDDSGQSTLSTL